ncbi:MAG: asparagine synthase-related protein [Candidatus Omnitrophota bacterium]
MQILLDEIYRWDEYKRDGNALSHKGAAGIAGDISQILAECGNGYEAKIVDLLSSWGKYGSGICRVGDRLAAWVDHIRSYPIFYADTDTGLVISNSARLLMRQTGLREPDEDSVLEFMTAGYVSGSHTLCKDIKALRAGELLLCREGERPRIIRWFSYMPVGDNVSEPSDLRAEMGIVIDGIFKDLIERTDGRPIWVPLSGGLDSRIVLAKLHEHGHRNIQAFSYGPKYNFEAIYARKVAHSLGCPWRFVDVGGQEARAIFEGDDRRAFWEYADGLKAAPSMREYAAILKLRESGLLTKDAVLINGQSGDYITGGHIAKCWHVEGDHDANNFFETVIFKHYGLWPELNIPANLERIKQRISECLPDDWRAYKKSSEWAKAEEIWEYYARQVCLVINGQRIYDYLGYDWELPLWDKKLVDFCAKLPLACKHHQLLYKDYLTSYNYKGLFPRQEHNIWRWPVHMMWVLPAAKIIGMVAGKNAKKKFYDKMKYFGHYGDQYAFFERKFHKQLSSRIRNIFSLYVHRWVQENGSLVPSRLYRSLPIMREGGV